MKNTKAQELRRKADDAKVLYAEGLITYEAMYTAAQAYIDECNAAAKRIAKEFGMKPKLMSAKAYLR